MQFVLSPKRLAEAKNDPMMCNEYWRDTVRAMSLSAVTGALSHLLVFLKRVCSCLWNACWSSKPMMSSSLMSSVASEARLHKPSKEAGSTWASCMNTAKNRRGGHNCRPLVPCGRRWRAAHKHSEEQVDEGVLSSLKAAVAAERAIVVERRAFSKMPAEEGLQVGQRLRPCSRTVAIHEPAFQQGAEQVQDAADMVDLLLPRPGVDDLEVLLHVRAQLPLHHGLDAMPLRQQRGAEQGAHDVA